MVSLSPSIPIYNAFLFYQKVANEIKQNRQKNDSPFMQIDVLAVIII